MGVTTLCQTLKIPFATGIINLSALDVWTATKNLQQFRKEL